ncbi:MAG: BsaWI family type II restriction enzyme, partial [Pyrinomonadaceae bacterium]|nr:BsaWI family type II restriction enzyme [Pyrinomonadaceae bacterium]
IDSDIVLLSKQQRKVVCVISVKKTFRERYSQSAYWALKSKERTFEYILATPDVDREIFDPDNPERYTKARSILENEMNAVFVLRDDLKCGEYGKLFVGKSLFIEYLRKMKFV